MTHINIPELTDQELMETPLDILVRIWLILDDAGAGNSSYLRRVSKALIDRHTVDLPL